MRSFIFAILCLALVGLLSAPSIAQDAGDAPESVMLRLRSGDILWGGIEGHDPAQVHFRRLEGGGLVHLPWAFLDPTQEGELRLRFGYVDAVSEELMMLGDRVTLSNGQELYGLIERRSDEFVYIKRAGGLVPVAKSLVAGSTTVQLPSLDVYTKDELYQTKFMELQQELVLPGERGAQAHKEVAQFAERLFDYRHAAHHYDQVRKLAPGFDVAQMKAALDRSNRKALLQDQVDELSQIDLWRARKLYAKAIEGLAAFANDHPSSPLLEDLNKLRERVAKYQERDVREQIVRRWHHWTVELSKRAVRTAESHDDLLAYADGTYTEDLLREVRDDLDGLSPGILESDILRLWQERKGGRYRQATYSDGTWLLGEEQATAGLEKDEEEEKKAAAGTAAAERQKLAKRLERYFQNQKVTRSKSGDHTEGETPEEFWKRWRTPNKIQWLRAYFIENSGHFSLARVMFANCRDCGGRRGRLVTFSGSAIAGNTPGEVVVPCQTCHYIGITRRIRYR